MASPTTRSTSSSISSPWGFTFSANANYIPEMLNAVGADPEHDNQSLYTTIDSYFAIDLRLSYTFSVPKAAPAPAVVDAKDAKDGKNVAPPVVAATGCDWRTKLLDGLTLAVGCKTSATSSRPLSPVQIVIRTFRSTTGWGGSFTSRFRKSSRTISNG